MAGPIVISAPGKSLDGGGHDVGRAVAEDLHPVRVGRKDPFDLRSVGKRAREVHYHAIHPAGDGDLRLPFFPGQLRGASSLRRLLADFRQKNIPAHWRHGDVPSVMRAVRGREMVGDTGLEPVTPCMSSRYSNHLSLIAHPSDQDQVTYRLRKEMSMVFPVGSVRRRRRGTPLA